MTDDDTQMTDTETQMTDEEGTEVAAIGVRLLDDAYLAWFSAEHECESALQAWWRSSGPSRSLAYAAYRAALDREEAAAHDLERLWSLADPCRGKLAVEGQAV
jgi:hypothetical protein